MSSTPKQNALLMKFARSRVFSIDEYCKVYAAVQGGQISSVQASEMIDRAKTRINLRDAILATIKQKKEAPVVREAIKEFIANGGQDKETFLEAFDYIKKGEAQ